MQHHKEIVLRARVKAHHEQRVRELCEQHNLSISDLFRSMIEGVEVKMRPTVGATLYVGDVQTAQGANHDQ